MHDVRPTPPYDGDGDPNRAYRIATMNSVLLYGHDRTAVATARNIGV
jgi:hypothetical protein